MRTMESLTRSVKNASSSSSSSSCYKYVVKHNYVVLNNKERILLLQNINNNYYNWQFASTSNLLINKFLYIVFFFCVLSRERELFVCLFVIRGDIWRKKNEKILIFFFLIGRFYLCFEPPCILYKNKLFFLKKKMQQTNKLTNKITWIWRRSFGFKIQNKQIVWFRAKSFIEMFFFPSLLSRLNFNLLLLNVDLWP